MPSPWHPDFGPPPGELLASIGKQWVLPSAEVRAAAGWDKPLGGWARLVRLVVATLPGHGTKALPAGTVLRVVSERPGQVKVMVDGHEQAMVRRWLAPAEPPPTVWERLKRGFDL